MKDLIRLAEVLGLALMGAIWSQTPLTSATMTSLSPLSSSTTVVSVTVAAR